MSDQRVEILEDSSSEEEQQPDIEKPENDNVIEDPKKEKPKPVNTWEPDVVKAAMEKAAAIKLEGNEHWKKGELDQAIVWYGKGTFLEWWYSLRLSLSRLYISHQYTTHICSIERNKWM